MSLEAQAKMLRALQENKITRVGGEKDITVDVRVIAATNKDLLEEVEHKRFRLDLYHRLSVILIHVPSLNDRRSDIPLLAEKFIKEICEEYTVPRKAILPKALQELENFNWTGNIRELRNVCERLVILCGEKITEEDLQNYVTKPSTKKTTTDIFEQFKDFHEFKEHFEKLFIQHRLKANDWNISKTADELNIQRSHLYNKIEKFELKRV